jgi:heptosyltransferase-2
LQTLEALDIPFEKTFPEIYFFENEIQNARKILTENGLTKNDNLVMISAFGSSEEKTYPLEYMAKILDYIVDFQPDVKMLCNYLPSQKIVFLKLYDSVSETARKAIVKDFDTKNLREFAAITSLCKCLIGNEGGATNISKSLKIPTFTIFSPQINLCDWAWTNNPDLDTFLHIDNFVPNSRNYSDFKPEFLKNSLEKFLNKALVN